MKYLKTYEAKGRKNLPSNIEMENRIKEARQKMIDEWEIADERSAITFNEFFENFPFDAFDDVSGMRGESGIYESGICAPYDPSASYSSSFSITIKGEKRYFSGKSRFGISGNLSDKEWAKRNIMIYAVSNTGGASGGSCYDTGEDDGAQPYEGNSIYLSDFLEYLKPRIDNVISNYANTKTSSQLMDILSSEYGLIGEDSYSNVEYYGNYDDYSGYYITLFNLFKFLAKNDSF